MVPKSPRYGAVSKTGKIVTCKGGKGSSVKLKATISVASSELVRRQAEYLYMIAAKKTAKHCKGLIPWERVNLATRTGFGRLARWVISQGIQPPPNVES